MNNEHRLLLQPHDEQLEQAVLGAILIGGTIADVAEHLATEDWYFSKHQAIYSAMKAVSERGEIIDYLAIGHELDKQGKLALIGGNSYLAELMVDVVSTSSMVSHAKAVKELSLLRSLLYIGQSLVLGAEKKTSSNELAAEAEHRIFTTMWARQVRPWRTSAEVMTEAVENLELMASRGEQLSGITTGLIDLDRMLGGWQPSDLVIIAARPSMGKSALMCACALAAAKTGAQVAISSLEMSARQLASRMIAIESRSNVFDLNNGRLDKQSAYRARKSAITLGALPIQYDDSGLITMDQLRAKARQLRIKTGLNLLFVDYLQLMSMTRKHRDSRQVEVSEISRGLKLLAKELGITVIAMSQLSRACEAREDRRPMMSDIRESGAIEQDADIILALYRDEVYKPDSLDKGIAEILIRKHRNGPIGDIKVAFLEAFALFINL